LKQRIVFAVLFALRCASPEPPVSTTTAPPVTATVAPPADTTTAPRPAPPAARKEITIDTVDPSNPLVVWGHARTFENAVSLRLRDARGNVIAEEHTTAVGEMGQHNPYEAHFWLTRDPGPRVTVEAFEYSAKDGSVQSLTSKSVPYAVELRTVTLMFPAGDCTNLRPFTRTLPKSIAMGRLLVEALVAGPNAEEKAAGATSPFPRGSALNKAFIEDGVVTVDFNERLQNVGGSCAALGIRESVTRTLLQLPTVKRVVIYAGGSEALALQP
jgi:Immunoglobulin-like domain of bacterial spore germination/Sporulation and spore germination